MIDFGQYISILATILLRLFWHPPGRAMIQAAGVSGTVRECLIVLTHCTVARTRKYQIVPTLCTCSQNKNTMLAGPDIATWPRASVPPHWNVQVLMKAAVPVNDLRVYGKIQCASSGWY